MLLDLRHHFTCSVCFLVASHLCFKRLLVATHRGQPSHGRRGLQYHILCFKRFLFTTQRSQTSHGHRVWGPRTPMERHPRTCISVLNSGLGEVVTGVACVSCMKKSKVKNVEWLDPSTPGCMPSADRSASEHVVSPTAPGCSPSPTIST